MGWRIMYNESSDIIEITYSGYITGQDLREAATKRISLQKETGSRLILSDATQVIRNPSIAEILHLPDKLYPEYGAGRDSRIALVLPKNKKEAQELGHFFKIVAKNRGWFVETFYDRQEALNWLLNISQKQT